MCQWRRGRPTGGVPVASQRTSPSAMALTRSATPLSTQTSVPSSMRPLRQRPSSSVSASSQRKRLFVTELIRSFLRTLKGSPIPRIASSSAEDIAAVNFVASCYIIKI